MAEEKEFYQSTDAGKRLEFEIGSPGQPVFLESLDKPQYRSYGFRPLASSYRVTIPPELSSFQQSEFLHNFINSMLIHMSGQTDLIQYWGPEGDERLREGGPGIEECRGYIDQACSIISDELSPYISSLTQEQKGILENVLFDFNGAWESLPKIDDSSLPDLWMARVFGVDPDAIYIPKTHFPIIRLNFFEEEVDSSRLKEVFREKFPGIKQAFKADNILQFWLFKKIPYESKFKHKESSLTEVANGDWPNATYAVNTQARAWECPIIVYDEQDNLQGIYKEIVQEVRSEDEEGNRSIICIPRLEETGLPSISNEVVAGPPVSEGGYQVVIPGKVPNEKFKKILAHVVNWWVSLQALDYYTVSEEQRPFLAFGHARDRVKTEEDAKLWESFSDWIKKNNLKIKFINPVFWRQSLLEKKSNTSQLN